MKNTGAKERLDKLFAEAAQARTAKEWAELAQCSQPMVWSAAGEKYSHLVSKVVGTNVLTITDDGVRIPFRFCRRLPKKIEITVQEDGSFIASPAGDKA